MIAMTLLATTMQPHTSSQFNWTGVSSSIFAAIGAIGAAVSAGASWIAIRQLARFERPLLVANFSTSADGKTSTVSITNVGKRTATFVLVLVMTHDTYDWGQLLDVVKPNETVKRTYSNLRIKLDDVPLAKVAVSCIDTIENVQLAWSMDGRVNYKARRQPQSLDIKEIFEMLYPNESFKGKTKVN